jgi:hypothetical protein
LTLLLFPFPKYSGQSAVSRCSSFRLLTPESCILTPGTCFSLPTTYDLHLPRLQPYASTVADLLEFVKLNC